MLDWNAGNVLQSHGIDTIESDDGMEVYNRSLNGEEYLFVMNHTDQVKTFYNENLDPYERKIMKP
ncbi:Beta-galactosidase C-terminal domain [Halobacillus salinus]|uniref:Beta-galactosidase C-terminal domain n=1 Tax=Halobacillus salinus TaxID=192814 RepID=UPI0009A75DE1|nr:Beta-galactosidase C-terminal domain [Halobacillus salinus]